MENNVHFVGSSLRVLQGFPDEVRREVGFSIRIAQNGGKAINVVPLVGFAGASILEIVSDFDGDTFRAVYTVRYAEAVYVLHAFQKKSKTGRSTPKKEMDLVRSRLRNAEADYSERYLEKAKEQRNAKRPRKI